jgi:hypothetical protein
MNELPKEFIDWNVQSAHVANENIKLLEIGKDIINKYCPFKKGDKVIYRASHQDKEHYGIVHFIRYRGIDEDAIENKWLIQVRPTKKDFTEIEGRFNMRYPTLGESKLDRIRKS